jgi:NodT family efflux transporter outer membrane factor (OMF) lipoprotein
MTACAPVGPDYVRPDIPVAEQWTDAEQAGITTIGQEFERWWEIFEDPVLNNLVEVARAQNNNLEIAGLRVLEARAQLGIATGSRYPQTQIASGDATYISPSDSAGGSSNFWQYNVGAVVSWEMDFWGRYRRGIESADAAYLASIAAFDESLILLTAQVVDTYTVLRATEEQIRIAEENLVLQQRSYEIAEVLYRNGADSELDMQQAQTLLLSTQATLPGFAATLKQTRNAMATLLGRAPGGIESMLAGDALIPTIPDNDITVVAPGDMLRRRPDVRRAELQAVAQNALVGVSQADLYPSFSLTGSIGLSAGGPGDSDFGDLFDTDALTWTAGPSFYWPFFNYDRIENNIRVQDARLQQALINYRETVIQAAREAEDAMASYLGTLEQTRILELTVESALRSNELSVVRYQEGFSDYQRVLDAQQALFNQQQRLVTNRANTVRSLVSLFKALGGGWDQNRMLIDDDNRDSMQKRTDWGDLLEPPQ